MNFFESVSDSLSFDFRSARFCADALTLARATGRPLADCRQDLFIAEGDMALAFDWLVAGYEGSADESALH